MPTIRKVLSDIGETGNTRTPSCAAKTRTMPGGAASDAVHHPEDAQARGDRDRRCAAALRARGCAGCGGGRRGARRAGRRGGWVGAAAGDGLAAASAGRGRRRSRSA